MHLASMEQALSLIGSLSQNCSAPVHSGVTSRAGLWFVPKNPQRQSMGEGKPYKLLEGLGANPSLMVLTSFPLFLAGQNMLGATQITEGVEVRDKTERWRLSLSPGA